MTEMTIPQDGEADLERIGRIRRGPLVGLAQARTEELFMSGGRKSYLRRGPAVTITTRLMDIGIRITDGGTRRRAAGPIEMTIRQGPLVAAAQIGKTHLG